MNPAVKMIGDSRCHSPSQFGSVFFVFPLNRLFLSMLFSHVFFYKFKSEKNFRISQPCNHVKSAFGS